MAQAVLDSPALEGFAGELVRDGDPDYDDLRSVFNASIDRRPALIARCSGVADVGSRSRCAAAGTPSPDTRWSTAA